MKRGVKSVLSVALVILMLFTSRGFVMAAEEMSVAVKEDAAGCTEETAEELATSEETIVIEDESVAAEASVSEEYPAEKTEDISTEETSVCEETGIEETTVEETVTTESTEETTVEETTIAESTEETTTEEEIDLSAYEGWTPEVVDEEEQAVMYRSLRARSVVPTDGSRYTVLLIDVSGSMSGTPINVAKQAAVKFCESVLKADGTNYVAVVKYASSSSVICDFTDDEDELKQAVSRIYASGGTNIGGALELAGEMLRQIDNADTVKNVVLLSDGLPEHGTFTRDGKYTYSDHYYSYGYANTAYNVAKTLHDDMYVYTLGFYHSLSGQNLDFGRRFMNDIQNAGYYEVTDASKLEFTFGEIAENIKALKKSGTFQYASDIKKENKNYTATYYYDDAYFTKSAKIYNDSLATMSICLAMSAFGSNETRTGTELDELGKDYSLYSRNVESLLKDIGFEEIQTNEYYNVKPQIDSIGVIAGHKKIKSEGKTYTLIAAAVRGAGYEAEWGSNLTIGRTGEHQGFREAKENVLKFLGEYVKEQGITGDVKLWITGYSRAAATTNLTAAALDRDAKSYLGDDIVLNNTDIYAYCFETPMGALKADNPSQDLYQNIQNVVNLNDPVPKVAMEKLGFQHYGNIELLPTAETDSDYNTKKDAMLKQYNALSSTTDYNVDNFQMKKISVTNILLQMASEGNLKLDNIVDDKKNNWSQSVFLNNFMALVTKDVVKNRDNYVKEYQDSLRELCSIYFGSISSDPIKMEKFKVACLDHIKEELPWIVGYIILKQYDDCVGVVEQCIVDAANDAGITGYSTSQVNSMAWDVVKILGTIVLKHPNYTVTLVQNISSIGSAHYPELCFSWLMSRDKNYTSNAFYEDSVNGDYRVIHINCPVDLNVYDSRNVLVASIVGDVPQEITGSEIMASITPDGDKEVILPPNEAYRIQITATDDGTVNYSLKEYSFQAGEEVRIINYFDIPITKGDILEGTVAQYSSETMNGYTGNGTDTEYVLKDKNGEVITPDRQVSGDDAKAAYCNVDVKADNTEGGVVFGGGIRQLDSFVKVEAAPMPDYEFDGWYDHTTKLSDNAEYRFRVSKDTTVTAHFTKKDGSKSSGPSESGQTPGSQEKPVNTTDKSVESISSQDNQNTSSNTDTSAISNNTVNQTNELKVIEQEAVAETAVIPVQAEISDSAPAKKTQIITGEKKTEAKVVEENSEINESETIVEESEEATETEETEAVSEVSEEVNSQEVIQETDDSEIENSSNVVLIIIIIIILLVMLAVVCFAIRKKIKTDK